MKTIGLIGGTSWTSTIEYYRVLNEEVARRLGGLNCCQMVIYNVQFSELEGAMHSGRWDDAANILSTAAGKLQAAGADAVVMCSNLIHRMYDQVQGAVEVPVLHLGDALAADIKAKGYKKVALLGARHTMQETFYRGRIAEKSGAEILIPNDADCQYIDTAIFSRMCANVYLDEDRARFLSIIAELQAQGAEAVILGCTELPVLLPETPIPQLSSIDLHCLYAVNWAMAA
ncbi:aspartate racemase [Rhizomicrobium palustre]|uniref:Aspartate racemase n=1 Tax=Rhizomicrobium palustre TaxID=189966 RepID=A0A846N2X2_9PROT|nr:amino acid racemase [Rhizomicrobium palustre]NIK89572.1 aspartate racemase [Rhizomicrobium palustre]